MTEKEKIEEKLKENNQIELLEEIEKLNEQKKEHIIEQINKIDFKELNKLYMLTKEEQNVKKEEITPLGYIDEAKLSKKEKESYKILGENIIKNNQYAVVIMAGGQGTRLGFKGPKGTYKLQVGKNGKYIFEILIETLKKSKEKYGILPYLYIMTSMQNNDETINFFKEHNFFEYDQNKVKFFKQGKLPMLTENGKMVIENDEIKTGSDGNGGVYVAMKKQGIIEDMKSKNVKWVYICGVDNIMVEPIAPVFIGATIKKNLQIASKSVAKAYPGEKVGVFCKKNGKPGIVEYIELSDEMKEKRDENGELVFGEANFISHLLSLEAIEKISNYDLKFHIAKKNGLYKFETFIFDAFEYFDDMLVMRVKREEEFAPIKNKEGVDSPETAVKLYENKIKN